MIELKIIYLALIVCNNAMKVINTQYAFRESTTSSASRASESTIPIPVAMMEMMWTAMEIL